MHRIKKVYANEYEHQANKRLRLFKNDVLPVIRSDADSENKRRKAVIVDLDDVFFYTNPIFTKAKNLNLSGDDLWKFFNKYAGSCPANMWALEIVKLYSRAGLKPIFITARSKELQIITIDAIVGYIGWCFELYMRELNDRRPSEAVKEDILTKEVLPRYNIRFALDDDIKNCEMFAKYGIPVLHVINSEGKSCPDVTKYCKTLAVSDIRSD